MFQPAYLNEKTRDPKGLYEKVGSGELKDFTGIDSLYEPPERPKVRIDKQNKLEED